MEPGMGNWPIHLKELCPTGPHFTKHLLCKRTVRLVEMISLLHPNFDVTDKSIIDNVLRPWVSGNVFDNMPQILVLPTISRLQLPKRKCIWFWTKAVEIEGSYKTRWPYNSVSPFPFLWIMGKVNDFKKPPCKCISKNGLAILSKVGLLLFTRRDCKWIAPRNSADEFSH